jgi:hypothetical protein
MEGLRTTRSAILLSCLPPPASIVDYIQNFAFGKGNLIRVVRVRSICSGESSIKISMIVLRKGLCDDIHAYSALAANNGGSGRSETLLDLAG